MPTKSARRRTATTSVVPPAAGAAAAASPAAEAWSLLFGLFFAHKDVFIAVSESLGMRPSEVRALLSLEHPLPMREVAGRMACDPSTLTGVVDRLEGEGYVERRPDGGDRRVKLLALTRSGDAARQQILARLHLPPDELLRLSVAEQRTLRDLVRKAVAAPA